MKSALLLVAGASFLGAQQAPPARMRPVQNMEQRLTHRLSLTAEQQNKVHTILAERDVIAKGSLEQAQALDASFTAAVKAGNEDQIERISQDIANLHQKQISLRGKTTAKIYAALSPTQQAMVGAKLELLMGRGFPPGPGARRGPGAPRKVAPPAAQ